MLAYVSAVVGPLLFAVLELEVPALGAHRLVLLLLPIAVSAALAGLRPALLATIVSAGCAAYLLIGARGFARNETVALGLFVLEAITTALLFEAFHSGRRRLMQALRIEREQQRLLAENEARLRHQIEAAESSRRKLSAEQDERQRAEVALVAAEEQLRQAQKMEAVGRLAGGVAHDFNNLLTVILGYAAMLGTRRSLPEEARADLKEIFEAGERAAELTQRLLAFSRKQVLEPRVIDLDAVVANLHKMLCRVLGEDIELEVSTTRSLARVKCDPGQIEQVIMNLVVNARDAMPNGGTLTIQTANRDFSESDAARDIGATPGRYAMLAVSDTGVGMDDATCSRIFEPFFTTKETGKGTGLGLSTAFGIVKQSGGWISVDSVPGEGSTFRVFLPETPEELGTSANEPRTSTRRGTETVLLVEDEYLLRALARRVLEGNGYRVLQACNGQEALELLESDATPVQLLLADVVMPKMGGRELAERVASLRPGVRALLVSGYAPEPLMDRDVAFLQKPYTVEALLDKVRSVLDSPARTSKSS